MGKQDRQRKTQTGNFTESIHAQDYMSPYRSKTVGAESLINTYAKSFVSAGAGSRVGEGGRRSVSLGGQWHFAVDQYDTCLRQRWYEENYTDADGRPLPVDFCFDAWQTAPVPSCWNMTRLDNERLGSPSLYFYEGSVVYTRTFDCERTSDERIFLRFGAANTTCMVFLNKHYLGMHTGGYTPFCFEVTELLNATQGGQGGQGAQGGSQENRLIAVVNNTRKPGGVPTDNTDWFNYGGLHRDVTLLRMPETFIRDFTISLVPGSGIRRIKAAVKVDGKMQDGAAKLAIEQLGIDIDIPVKDGAGEIIFEAEPELWSPDSPHLYEVSLEYGGDTLVDRIGLREIAVSAGRIMLNGSEIFLKGVCAHEESVTNGNAVTEAEVRENFALAKEMGCNFMRLAHYPHNEAAARIADEVGMLLWEEIPVYWAIEFDSFDTYANAENQLSELIVRDRNRASVIIWSVGNENHDSDERLSFMSRLAAKARSLDPTRLVSAACLVDVDKLEIRDRLAEHLDIIGINEYYGWYDPDFSKLPKIFENSRPSKPVVITEFGADAKAGSGGGEGELYTEGNQLAVYKKQLETLGAIPYIKGIAPWIFFDFRCPRRLHPMQGLYNIKGLLSADKKHKKPAFKAMKAFYTKPSAPSSK